MRSTSTSPVAVSAPRLKTLLEIRWGLGAFGVGVGLRTGGQPAVSTHGDRVAGLDVVGLAEELAGRGPDAVRQRRVHAVSADQNETRSLQTCVDIGGDLIGAAASFAPT